MRALACMFASSSSSSSSWEMERKKDGAETVVSGLYKFSNSNQIGGGEPTWRVGGLFFLTVLKNLGCVWVREL